MSGCRRNTWRASSWRWLSLDWGLPQVWGSGRYRHWWVCIVGGLEFLSESGTERPIVNGAANLQQEIGTSSRPAHLLRLVHAPIDQKVCRPYCDRSANTQTGAIPLGVIDEPDALATEIVVDLVQRVP